MKSSLFSLNLSDFGKGLILAVITAVLTFVVELLKEKGFNLSAADLNAILQIALTSFIGYLAKNFLSNNEGQFGRSDK